MREILYRGKRVDNGEIIESGSGGDMNKQEQIEELARIIGVELGIEFGDGDAVDPEDRPFQAEHIAFTLYKAGYLKADNVRRETAMDIIETIRCCKFALKDSFDIALEGMIGKIAEDYGVEVKEWERYYSEESE